MTRNLTTALLGTGALLVLASCVGTTGGPNISDYATACMFEVNPTGSYVWSDGDVAVKAGGGGTVEGEAAMNACISRKAAEAGVSLAAPTTRQGVAATTEVETSSGTVVETFTYGTPPSAGPTSPAVASGGESCRSRNVLSGGTGYYGCTR